MIIVSFVLSLQPKPHSRNYSLDGYSGLVRSGMSSRNAQILSRSRRKEFEKSCVRGTICNAPCLCIILIFNELRQYPLSFFPHIFPTKCNFIASCWMQKVVSQSMDSNFCHFCEAIKAFPNLPLMAGLFSICHPYQQRFYR